LRCDARAEYQTQAPGVVSIFDFRFLIFDLAGGNTAVGDRNQKSKIKNRKSKIVY
jgi:hypothetical protein